VSLFAGVGGFDLALRNAGVPTVAAVEIDDAARGVLAHHFPETTLFTDVRTVTADDLRNAGAVPERTILTGGFPCQPFSVAGRRQGMDDEKGRGDLYFEISRLLADFAPAWVVLENVPGLLSIDGGRTMGTILRDLGERGYGFCYRVLDAQHFGVPQRRRRVFIVGRLGDDRGPVQVLLEPEGGAGDPAPSGEAGQATTDRTSRSVVGALTARGVGTCGADDNQGQAGHLIPFVKGKRASTDQDDETWDARSASSSPKR
jgi:DNA (cytosine-5)-methyltransferase 1